MCIRDRSRLELERKLEQLRALENKMSIHVGYTNAFPLSVDTKEDLIKVENIMKKNEKNYSCYSRRARCLFTYCC